MIDDLQRQLRDEGSITFPVRVRPGAAQSIFREIMDDGSIKIGIAAVADEGKANTELTRFLAEEFSVSKVSVEIISGQTSRQKIVRMSL